MQDIVYQGLEFVFCMIEALIIYVFCSRCYHKRVENKWYQMMLVLFVSIALYLKGECPLSILQNTLFLIIVVGAYIGIQYQVKFWQGLVHATIYCVCTWMSELITIEAYCSLHQETTLQDLMQFHLLRYNVGLISKIICFVSLLYISEKKANQDKTDLPVKNTFILLWTCGLTFIGLNALDQLIRMSLEWTNDSVVDSIFCFLSICIYLINVGVYWTVEQLNESARKEKEYALIEYQNKLLIQSTEENQAVENEWRRIRHDINNHISCIDMLLQMGNVEKARAYIQNLTQNMQSKVYSVHIGNDIANAVINQKIARAKQQKIDIIINGSISEQLKMADMDLCVLLSNSLDNAIEATCQIECYEQRKIELNMNSSNKRVEIQLSNAVKEEIAQTEYLTTTKKDKKRHGIGMRSMQTVVEKYGGTLKWHCEKSVFILEISLPIE